MPPDQPTDAGKDRETAEAIAKEFGDACLERECGDAIAHALAAAREEGRREEQELLEDAVMYLESARRMLADTDISGTPWFDGLTRTITALRGREEPSR